MMFPLPDGFQIRPYSPSSKPAALMPTNECGLRIVTDEPERYLNSS
jgi:hypothetical protein